VNAKATSVFAK